MTGAPDIWGSSLLVSSEIASDRASEQTSTVRCMSCLREYAFVLTRLPVVVRYTLNCCYDKLIRLLLSGMVLSCLVLSCLVLSCLVFSCLVMSCRDAVQVTCFSSMRLYANFVYIMTLSRTDNSLT